MIDQIQKKCAEIAAKPVGATQRLASMDVLRGFALLGILPMNMISFAGSTMIMHSVPVDVARALPGHDLDVAMLAFEWLFFEGKMRALFAVLFGAGTVLLLDRIEERSGAGAAADVFHRRSMWLLTFGLVHGVAIWDGDILMLYGSLALLALYPLRHVPARRLIAFGLFSAMALGSLGVMNFLHVRTAIPEASLQEQAREAVAADGTATLQQIAAQARARRELEQTLASIPKELTVARASYLDMVTANAVGLREVVSHQYSNGLVFEMLGFMIMGMGLYKSGFLVGRLPSKAYTLVAAGGYAISIPIVSLGLWKAAELGFSRSGTTAWLFTPYEVANGAAMLANASMILLAIRHRFGVFLQSGLAAVGRMAFTNYIATSLIAQVLFRWGPWRLYGTVEFYQQAYVIIAIWSFNFAFSLIWLRIFAFGPLEWAWRSLTYVKLQPWRSTV